MVTDWNEPFTASYRFMRVDRKTMYETGVLDMLLQSGTISRNADTSTKESGSLTAYDWRDISPDFVRVYLDAEGMYTGWRESVILGTFIPSVTDTDVDGPTSKCTVDLDGLLGIVEGDDFYEPVTLAAGQDVVGFCVSEIEACGLRVEADPSDYVLASQWVYSKESSTDGGKLSAINELLDMAGFYSAYTDTAGTVQLRRYTRPSDKAPSHIFNERAGDRFMAKMSVSDDYSGVRNAVKAVFSTQDTTVVGVAENTDPASKWSIPSLGRRVVGTYRYDYAVAQEEADAKASSLLYGQSAVSKVLMDHVLVPTLRLWDTFGVVYPTGGVEGTFSVRTQKISLGAGCITSLEGRRYGS